MKIVEEENVIVFGLPETISDDAVGEVCNTLDEKANFEASRIGKKRVDAIRPSKI